jgi:hypothetical protein
MLPCLWSGMFTSGFPAQDRRLATHATLDFTSRSASNQSLRAELPTWPRAASLPDSPAALLQQRDQLHPLVSIRPRHLDPCTSFDGLISSTRHSSAGIPSACGSELISPAFFLESISPSFSTRLQIMRFFGANRPRSRLNKGTVSRNCL